MSSGSTYHLQRHAKSRMFFALLFLLPFVSFPQSYKQLCASYKGYQEQGNSDKQFATAGLLIKQYHGELQKDPVWYAELENGNGHYYFNHSQFDSAIYCYSRAVNQVYSVKADTSFDYGLYLYNLAYVCGTAGYYEKGEQYYAVSLPILGRFLGASSGEYTSFYRTYVEMKIDMGDYAAATPMNDALIYFYRMEKGEQSSDYLHCLNNKARIAQGQANYTEAASLFLQILNTNLTYQSRDTVTLSTMYNNIAECYRLMGNYAAAEPMYLEALRLETAYAATTKESLAVLFNNMGLLYKAQSNYSKAESCFLKSIGLYKAANYQQHVAFANPLNNLGDLYRITGNYKEAVSCIEQAIAIRKATSGENHEYYANALSNLALLNMEFDYLDEAEQLLLQCESIYKNRLGENNPRYANCLSLLSSVYARKKDFSKALDYNTRCLRLMEKSGASRTDKYALYLSGKGSVECDMKNYSAAAETFGRAAEIFKSNFGSRNFNYTDMQFSLANVHERAGNTSEATRYYLGAMGAYKSIMEDNFVSMSEEEKTNFYYVLSNRFETFYNYVIGLSRQAGFRNDSLLKTLLNVRLVDKSLLLNEARAVNQTILNGSDTAVARVFSEWLQQKRYLQELYKYSLAELAQNNIDLDAEESLKNSLEKQLSASSATFRKTTTAKNTFAELQSKLRKSDLGVEIIRTAVYDDRGKATVNYAALLIGKDYKAPKLVPLDSCAFFDTLFINHYKRCIEDTLIDALSYKRFFKALKPYCQGISNIYFSADGVYQKLNLYTLYDVATGKYLLETMSISQLNSLKDLLDPKAAPAATAEAALFGFPDYELKTSGEKTTDSPELASRSVFSDIPELPGTKKETEAIGALLTSYKRHISLYLGPQATEEQVKALGSPAILHIATHGFFLPDEESGDDKTLGFSTQQVKQNPLLRSGLLMAGAAARQNSLLKQDDGILTAYEASLLNLQNTDLVTLSACETGLGDLVNGQGVYGLQRAFLTAGARSVVMSLWVVDDDATQQLMTEFYKNYLGNTATGDAKREALHKAQLEVRKHYPHPYHWGAFVLIGN